MDKNIYSPPASNVATQANSPAIWNPNVAGLWSVFLTPVFGSILVLRNWQALDESPKAGLARLWLGISLLMALLQFSAPALFPASTLAINVILFAYLIIWYFAWQRPQTRYVKERWGTEYNRRAWLVPVLVGLVGVVVASMASLQFAGQLNF